MNTTTKITASQISDGMVLISGNKLTRDITENIEGSKKFSGSLDLDKVTTDAGFDAFDLEGLGSGDLCVFTNENGQDILSDMEDSLDDNEELGVIDELA